MHTVEVVPHTADVALRVTADRLDELFVAGTEGMAALMWSCPPSGSLVRRVEVRGDDTADLLWRWLSAVLGWAEADDACYFEAEVRLGDGEVTGTVRGTGTERCEVAGPAVKAVTLHGLEVREEAGRWSATVVFDV